MKFRMKARNQGFVFNGEVKFATNFVYETDDAEEIAMLEKADFVFAKEGDKIDAFSGKVEKKTEEKKTDKK